MSRYIDADKLIAEIEGLLKLAQNKEENEGDFFFSGEIQGYKNIITIIDSLQQDPRFPLYDNIVEKVFGAGNLDGWERDEAEILVALAKEELLKSLQQEQPEVDLEKVVEFECIGKKIKMTIQELINYYIDSECCDVADECGF